MKDTKTKFKYPKTGKVRKQAKNLKALVKQEVKKENAKELETKEINVTAPLGGVNTIFVPYGALSGVQILIDDLFKMPQGAYDSSLIGSPNRIGDKVHAIGFEMNYYFHIANQYQLSSIFYPVPFVKLRITAWRQSFGQPILNQALLYDGNYLNTNTSTLQPINYDEGYLKTKDLIYDKVIVVKNNYSGFTPTSVFAQPLYGNVFHFRKYIKYDKLIRYADNNSTNPTGTIQPIFIGITAEIDDSNTGLVPSGAKIMWTTGYTRGWFKDA